MEKPSVATVLVKFKQLQKKHPKKNWRHLCALLSFELEYDYEHIKTTILFYSEVHIPTSKEGL